MFGHRFGGLGVVFVEVERRIELGLARQQSLQARLVLERPVDLHLIIVERFFQALQVSPFALRSTVETALRVVDALRGADRIAGVEVRGVTFRRPG